MYLMDRRRLLSDVFCPLYLRPAPNADHVLHLKQLRVHVASMGTPQVWTEVWTTVRYHTERYLVRYGTSIRVRHGKMGTHRGQLLHYSYNERNKNVQLAG